jgi:cytidine deaminase
MSHVTKKLALLGNTGVGKDTFVKIFQKRFSTLSMSLIKLAAPLYEGQNAIYQICATEIDSEIQDGILLNFLGNHMRRINPNVIKESFLRELQKIGQEPDIIICHDARPLDVPFVKEAGFFILNITTDFQIALERRKARGDLSLGSSDHSTEKGLTAELYDAQILNNGTLHDFEQTIVKFINAWIQ